MVERKKILVPGLLISVLLLVLSGCIPAAGPLAQQLFEAVNAQKPDAALNLFTYDAVVRVEGASPISGRQAIRAWLEGLAADEVKLAESEILKQDETSFRASYSLTMASASRQGVDALEGVADLTAQMGKITSLKFAFSEASRVALQQAAIRQGAPALSYVVLTDPERLQASPGGEYTPNRASLTVAITNETGGQVRVRSISFRIPEGTSARDLTPNITGVNSEAPDRWHITNKEGRLMLAPELSEDGVLEAGQGLSITLSKIEINDQPGVWSLEVFEETGDAATGRMTIQLAKSPFTLNISDLSADPLVVEPKGSTVLSWVGSDGATYHLHNGHEFVDVKSTDTVVVDNLEKTTTFYLTATLVGAEDLPPVIRERTVTVSSASPITTLQPAGAR